MRRKPSNSKEWENLLARELRKATGLPWVREHRFCRCRKWRFDMANRRLKLAVEIEGSSHCRVRQRRLDSERHNYATGLGWRILYYPASSVRATSRRGDIVEQIHRTCLDVAQDPYFARILTSRR